MPLGTSPLGTSPLGVGRVTAYNSIDSVTGLTLRSGNVAGIGAQFTLNEIGVAFRTGAIPDNIGGVASVMVDVGAKVSTGYIPVLFDPNMDIWRQEPARTTTAWSENAIAY